jgi:hypothetical protein
MRDYKTSRFTKAVRIKEEHLSYLKGITSKKSVAGRLEEIIELHKSKYGKDSV